MSYRYILRYYIDPYFSSEERIEELAQFCKGARVEEVMLFITPEELSPGHPTEEEISLHIELAKRVKHRLGRDGVGLSLNPWSTIYAVSRGRKLRDGQDFRLMRGESGRESPVVACPLCEHWQAYLCADFFRLVAEVRPVALWIEDDWRLHNHGGELGWGGCFCDAHMDLFSSEVGQRVTREQLLRAILQEGEPHPWRAQWLTLSRMTLIEPLRKVCDAIRSAHGETRVGLMTSMPDQHSIEGRDWSLWHKIVADEKGLLLRPHMRPYTQERALRVTPAITRQTLACFREAIEVYPELENSPRCGIYAKSATYTIWQMMEAAVFGSKGITINHYDMIGNGIALDPDLEVHLAAAKPVLNAMRELEIDDRLAEGVQVLFSPDIASHLHLYSAEDLDSAGDRKLSLALQDPSQSDSAGPLSGGSMQQLAHSSVVWSDVCSILGIAHRMTMEIDPKRGPIVVGGQTLRAFSQEDIDDLLTGVVILDAESAMVLLERGYGPDIGVESADWRALEDVGFSYEEILEEDLNHYRVATPRMTAQRCSERLLAMDILPQARPLTTIYSGERKALWAGAVSFSNSRGGRITTLCYPLDGKAQFFMGFFNIFRQQFFRRILFDSRDVGALVMAEGGLRCFCKKVSKGLLMVALNPTDDQIESVCFIASKFMNLGRVWKFLSDDGAWYSCSPTVKEDSDSVTLRFAEKLEPLKIKAFLNLEAL